MAGRNASQNGDQFLSMILAWTRSAQHDRRSIREYIAQHNPGAALALDELFSVQAERLKDHPALGRSGRVSGTRELVAHQNYILVYTVSGESVVVVRVLHASQQWPKP